MLTCAYLQKVDDDLQWTQAKSSNDLLNGPRHDHTLGSKGTNAKNTTSGSTDGLSLS